MQQGDLALASRAGRWVLVITVLGSALVYLDSTVVNVALPLIGHDLHARTAGLQWVLNGYLLSLTALILLGGSLGDRFGRRKVFVIGTVIFTAASAGCAAAPNIETLVMTRLLQGIGGALLTPGSLAMLEALLRPSDRAKGIGAWSGLSGVSSAAGPLLGGYLVVTLSWRAIFLINVPLGVLAAVLSVRHLPETRSDEAGPPDTLGALLAALSLGGLTFALVEGPAGGSPATLAVAASGGLIAAIAFVAAERVRPHPMLPLSLFTSSQFSVINILTFVVYGVLGGVLFLAVAFLQVSLGYSALETGAAMLPVTLLMLAFSPRSGRLAERMGPRLPLTLGPLLMAGGLALLAVVGPGDTYWMSVLPALVLFGAGLTLVVTPLTATVLAAVEVGHAGIASGVNNGVSRLASLVAVAILPAVGGLSGTAFYRPTAMLHGFHVAAVLSAGGCLGAAAFARLRVRPDALGARPAAAPGRSCATAGAPLHPVGSR